MDDGPSGRLYTVGPSGVRRTPGSEDPPEDPPSGGSEEDPPSVRRGDDAPSGVRRPDGASGRSGRSSECLRGRGFEPISRERLGAGFQDSDLQSETHTTSFNKFQKKRQILFLGDKSLRVLVVYGPGPAAMMHRRGDAVTHCGTGLLGRGFEGEASDWLPSPSQGRGAPGGPGPGRA